MEDQSIGTCLDSWILVLTVMIHGFSDLVGCFVFLFCISDFAVFLCNERVMMCVPFVEKTNEQTKTKYKQKTEKRNFFHLCYY